MTCPQLSRYSDVLEGFFRIFHGSHFFRFSRIFTAYKPREHTNGSASQRGWSRILTTNQELNFCRMNNKVFSGYSSTVVPAMNGHLRDQAKVSVHCRWPLIRGDLTLKCVGRGIDNVAEQGRWPLTTGVAQGRYYCSHIFPVFQGF